MFNYKIYSDNDGFYIKDLKMNSSFQIPCTKIYDIKDLGDSEYVIVLKPYKEYIYYHLDFKKENKIVFRFLSNKVKRVGNTYIARNVECGTSEDIDELDAESAIVYNPKNKKPLKCDYSDILDDNKVLCANCMNLDYSFEKDRYSVDDILYYVLDDDLKTDKLYSARKDIYLKMPDVKKKTYRSFLKSLKNTITGFYNENYKPYSIRNLNDIKKLYEKK